MSGVGLKALLKGTKDGGNTFDMDEAAVFLEDFEEPTHMCSFELVGRSTARAIVATVFWVA